MSDATLNPQVGRTFSLATLPRQLVSDAKHGPLPAMLLALTVFTGVVDAVSILALGRVFVANMTGNVVFIGFGLAGAPGFSLSASLIGLGGFLVGALAAGRAIERLAHDRGRLFAAGTAVEVILVAAALLETLPDDTPTTAARNIAVALLALATGIQNAVVRRLAVPDLTTTVLTMTLTGIASDHQGGWPTRIRRVLAVLAMLVGAIIGAELIEHVRLSAALGVATALVLTVAICAEYAARHPGAWRETSSPHS